MKIKDIKIGLKKGRITIIRKVPKPEHLNQRGTYWEYSCECGAVKVAHSTTVWRSLMSCGCSGKEKKYTTCNTTYYRRLYYVWHQMIKRCGDKNNKNYQNYGGRGILVHTSWMDYGVFYNDMIGTYVPGLTIERIDIDKGYSKDNCTWIPNTDQSKNRRSSLSYRLATGYKWKYSKCEG